MSQYDETGKNVLILDGRYVVTTPANTLYFADNRRVKMTPIINKSSGGLERCFIIEGQGRLLASTITDSLRVGDFQQFYVKLIS